MTCGFSPDESNARIVLQWHRQLLIGAFIDNQLYGILRKARRKNIVIKNIACRGITVLLPSTVYLVRFQSTHWVLQVNGGEEWRKGTSHTSGWRGQCDFILHIQVGKIEHLNFVLQIQVGKLRKVNFVLHIQVGKVWQQNFVVQIQVGKVGQWNFVFQIQVGKVGERNFVLNKHLGKVRVQNFVLQIHVGTMGKATARFPPLVLGQ